MLEDILYILTYNHIEYELTTHLGTEYLLLVASSWYILVKYPNRSWMCFEDHNFTNLLSSLVIDATYAIRKRK